MLRMTTQQALRLARLNKRAKAFHCFVLQANDETEFQHQVRYRDVAIEDYVNFRLQMKRQ